MREVGKGQVVWERGEGGRGKRMEGGRGGGEGEEREGSGVQELIVG